MANIILVYTGDKEKITKKGKESGTQYIFGTKKKEFFADARDVPALLKAYSTLFIRGQHRNAPPVEADKAEEIQ